MDECIFCKIASGAMKSDPIYQDDLIYAFTDISPQAPTHILIIPKLHFVALEDMPPELLGRLLEAAPKIAKQLGLPLGYRLVFNYGPEAGQLVPHLHVHLLAGRRLHWPPG